MCMPALYKTNTLSCIVIMISHLNNYPQVDMFPHLNTLFTNATYLAGEATNANFIVFGLSRRVLEPTIYNTRNEHANTPSMQSMIKNSSHTCYVRIRYNK